MIRFRKQRLMKFKFALSIFLTVILGIQIWFLVTLIKYNTTEYRSVTIDDFITLSEGDKVKGSIYKSQVIAYFENDYRGSRHAKDITLSESPSVRTRNIAVADKDGNVFLMYATMGELSGNYDDLGKLMDESINTFRYKGKVTGINGISKEDVLSEIKEEGTASIFVSDNISDKAIGFNDANESQDIAYLVWSIIGVILMLALIVFLMWKSVNNFIYGYLVNRGKIEPELKIKREDLIIQNDVNYFGSDNDSDSFYVNNEKDEQTSENTDTNTSEFHFTKRMRDNENNTLKYERKEPTFSDGSPIDFYSGGVNEDGNFYVDKSSIQSVDGDGEELKKY